MTVAKPFERCHKPHARQFAQWLLREAGNGAVLISEAGPPLGPFLPDLPSYLRLRGARRERRGRRSLLLQYGWQPRRSDLPTIRSSRRLRPQARLIERGGHKERVLLLSSRSVAASRTLRSLITCRKKTSGPARLSLREEPVPDIARCGRKSNAARLPPSGPVGLTSVANHQGAGCFLRDKDCISHLQPDEFARFVEWGCARLK
jgi:hypothetical protein